MKRAIAYCGLDCNQCPTFMATQADDDAGKEKVARQWSKMFQMELTAKDITCDGCKSETGRLFGHCQQCEIKKCAAEKKLENCATCEDYACDKLEAFFAFAPHARKSLERIRDNR